MVGIPKRIILSRKGFDTTFGGCASAILPDGRLVSFPIPEDASAKSTQTTFGSLGTAYGHSFAELISSLKRSDIESWKKRPVHLDPDIRPGIRPRNRDDERGFFGQDGSFETTLQQAGVSDPDNGSLFLFYGWFREIRHESGKYRYTRRDSFRSQTHRQHCIWGWLQVGDHQNISRVGPVPRVLQAVDHHPHIEHRDRPTNAIYIATDRLTFDLTKPGSGVFSSYNPALRLTSPSEHRMSYWSVPQFLRTCATGGLKTQWDKQPATNTTLFYRGYGQEFIFDTSNHMNETQEWLANIFGHA